VKYGKGGRKQSEGSWRNGGQIPGKKAAKAGEATTRRGGKVPGGRSKTAGGGGAAGLRGAKASAHGGGREEERGKGKIEA